jgi:hypothetical protein
MAARANIEARFNALPSQKWCIVAEDRWRSVAEYRWYIYVCILTPFPCKRLYVNCTAEKSASTGQKRGKSQFGLGG